MIYDLNGNALLDNFADNMTLDYAYDSATGANYSVIRVFQTKKDGTKQYPFLRYPGRMTAVDLATQEGWQLIINAGLGVSAEQPIDGIAIQNSTVIYDNPATYHAGCIPLTIDSSGNLGTAATDASAATLVQNGIVSATCGFCPIIENYTNSTFPSISINGGGNNLSDQAMRQIIGQFGDGDYAIVSCAGRTYFNSDGWSLTEAQTVCQKLGLKFAYALDGGKSVSTILRKKPVWDFMTGTTRIVPSFIVFNGTTTYSVPSA